MFAIPTLSFSRTLSLLIGMLALTAAAAASAQDAANATDPAAIATLPTTVVVSGEQPGPGLWRVSKDGHQMWVLGTLLPLPKRMEWNGTEVEQRIEQSSAYLHQPGLNFSVKGGMFRALFLLPSIMKTRNNPDKQKLQDVLSAEDYQRWLVLKQQYIGRSRSVEKRRPLVAAQDLMEKAIRKNDMTLDNFVAKRVRKLADRAKLEQIRPNIEIRFEDPKQALNEFNTTQLEDTECFRRMLDRVGGEIEQMKLRANAWAVGEIDILRQLTITQTYRSCADALLETKVAERYGLGQIEQRLREEWLNKAEETLATHATSFALLPMPLVVGEDSFLDRLVERGYRVQAPNELEEAVQPSDLADAGAAPSARDELRDELVEQP